MVQEGAPVCPGVKTITAITQLGKNYQQLVHRGQPQPGGSLPVAYLTVPPAATPKMLAVEFARFLGLPLPARFSQVELTNKVCDLRGTLRTTLFPRWGFGVLARGSGMYR